jgi:hypothetical protein
MAVLRLARSCARGAAQSLADVPNSLTPRFVAGRAREGSLWRAGCFLAALCCWVTLPFAALLVVRVHARLGEFDPELVLNETLAAVPDFELAVRGGVATRLPSDGFRAVLPAALFQLLADQTDPLHGYGRAALQQAVLWWQSVYDPQHSAGGTWWRETQSFGVAGPNEFQLGELVTVRKPRTPWHGGGLSALWPTAGSERAKAAERLAKIVGVHPSRTLSDFSYTVVYCDGNNDLSQPDLRDGKAFRRRAAPNCTATVDTSLVDPKTRRGRELRYGLSVHGTRLAFVRATFGAQHTRISSAEAALADPPEGAYARRTRFPHDRVLALTSLFPLVVCAAVGNLTNARALYGRVAVVRRGGCEFVEKATRIQQAGAIALIIVNYEDEDVKAGSAEDAAAAAIAIPVVTVRQSVGEPLVAHAARVSDAFEQRSRKPSQFKRQKVRGVEIDLAFGAARHMETATEIPRATAPEESYMQGQSSPQSQAYWQQVEASWRREGGWRGDPGLRGRQVVVNANRLRRAGAAGQTVGAVNGASVMEWEDNWPALSAQAETLFTPHQIFTFAGYSHHYGGFWRFEDDPSDRAVSYPYTQAGLQSIAPLWLASLLFCEAPQADAAAANPCSADDDTCQDDGGSSSGEEDASSDQGIPPMPMAVESAGGMISYDSSPYLDLSCSNAIGASRASALVQGFRSGMFGAAASLKLHYGLADVMMLGGLCLESVARQIPAWGLLYVPACYVSCNVMRHVDSPYYSLTESILISAYAYTPIALLDGLSHGLSRALGSSPPMLPSLLTAGERPPEWLNHFAVELVRAFWTPLGAFALWSAFLAYRQRAIRAEGTDAEVQSAGVMKFLSRTQSGWMQQTSVGAEHSSGDGSSDSREDEDADATVPPMCRICMDGVDEEGTLGPLISPCLCRGSMSYVHTGCLNRWRAASANPSSTTHCDNCKYRYRLEMQWRPSHIIRSAILLLAVSGAAVMVGVVCTAQMLQLGDKISLLSTGYSLGGPSGMRKQLFRAICT